MSRKSPQVLAAVAIFASFIFFVAVSAPQSSAQAPTLKEQLAAQYKLAKMGSDSSGYAITEEGTLLSIQKGGIMGLPYKSTIWPNDTFQDGTVHASSMQTAGSGKAADFGKKFCGLTHKCPSTPDAASNETSTKLFKNGDKVYATKIDVNLDKDTVTMGIVSCDTCNKTDPPTYNKANVIFQFAKGTLSKTSAGEVEDTIGQLLAISNDDQQAQGQGDQQQQGGDQGGQQQAQGQQPAPAQQPDPQTIQMGQTTDQVVATLGKPDKDVKLGTKEIFIYKDMKVTFKDGKVSDVQ